VRAPTISVRDPRLSPPALFPVVVIEKGRDPEQPYHYARFTDRRSYVAYKGAEALDAGDIEALRVSPPTLL
jgi:hypothetical protein